MQHNKQNCLFSSFDLLSFSQKFDYLPKKFAWLCYCLSVQSRTLFACVFVMSKENYVFEPSPQVSDSRTLFTQTFFLLRASCYMCPFMYSMSNLLKFSKLNHKATPGSPSFRACIVLFCRCALNEANLNSFLPTTKRPPIEKF